MADKSVLIVEDEDNFARALDIILTRHGYVTHRVSDGDAALTALNDNPPALILLDVLLPNRSGFEICQTIRQTPHLRNTRIVMMSARNGQAEQRKGMAMGADAFLNKPFPTSDLLSLINKLTGKDTHA